MSPHLYVDTSVLVTAFTNEPQQAAALAVLRDPQWASVAVSDWTLAEFACAINAKVLRGETPADVAHEIALSLKRLISQGAVQRVAVLREDYSAVQTSVNNMNTLVRGADALHLAVAKRIKASHFASLDITQRKTAAVWLDGVACVPS
jgi:uncharacterized protein